MDPFTVTVNVALPREQVFEYLADIANHAEFTDHYLVDWRLTRVESYGEGAGARFRAKVPLNRFSWADMTLAELQPPFKIVEAHPGITRVEYTYETDAHVLSDVIAENTFGRSWAKRKAKKSMKRLRAILEEGRMRGKRPSVAAG